MTFSIVARCAQTGQLGVAVSTAVPAVGAMCPYLHAQVGAVTTQSWVNPYLAIDALKRLAAGERAQQALDQVVQADPSAALRQLAIVDRHGETAVWTGPGCTGWAGHRRGAHYAVQGNMLTGEDTVNAMAAAFDASATTTANAPLAERLLSALEAGQAAGGDKRGRQSAALKVVGDEAYALLDLRVDEHPDPVAELRRVYGVAQRQLAPFVAGMPTRDDPGRAPPDEVTALLLTPPCKRAGATRAATDDAGDSAVLARWMGTRFSADRVAHNLGVYRGIVEEIARLRELDLSTLHPAIVFDPLRVGDATARGDHQDD